MAAHLPTEPFTYVPVLFNAVSWHCQDAMKLRLDAVGGFSYRELLNYKAYLQGVADRLVKVPCRFTDGRYLDGWYVGLNDFADATPDFLTVADAAMLRRLFPDFLEPIS